AIPVMPLLVSGASMPPAESLPADLAPLAYRNALLVRADPDFRRDMDRVIKGIEVNARDYRQAQDATRRERQRASKLSTNPAAARALATQAEVAPPSRGEEVASPQAPTAPPRAPLRLERSRGSAVRRDGKGLLVAVATAFLLIALGVV